MCYSCGFPRVNFPGLCHVGHPFCRLECDQTWVLEVSLTTESQCLWVLWFHSLRQISLQHSCKVSFPAHYLSLIRCQREWLLRTGGHRWRNSSYETLPKAMKWSEVLQLTSCENGMTQCPILHPRFLYPPLFILPGLDFKTIKQSDIILCLSHWLHAELVQKCSLK